MKPTPHSAEKGTVILVALCFVAVLGISLAGYIAVCSRAMNISNRSYQAGLSRQLAEMGLELCTTPDCGLTPPVAGSPPAPGTPSS